MRLLVISDSHGSGVTVDRIIRKESAAKEIFFLGDVVSDIEDLVYEYTDRNFHIVRGNCDFCSMLPSFDIVKLEELNIFMTHGHNYGVKSGTDALAAAAKRAGCRIALYGHTHVSDIKYENGLYIVNPGSVSRSRGGADSYAVIDIMPSGILPAVKPVNT